MTTESMLRSPFAGSRVLLVAALVAVLGGLLVTGVGTLLAGAAAARGALVGTLLAVAVLGFGALVVNAVAGVLPSAALLVALLTYTLQVLVMGLVFWAITSAAPSGSTDAALDQRWLGLAAIGATLGWMTGQISATVRQRIPAYDLVPAEPLVTGNGGHW